MRGELITLDDLVGKYPTLYGRGVPCGVWVPIEWGEVILKLSADIESYITENGLVDFQVQQIKEKFGGLRFYVSHSDEYIDGLIRQAEEDVSVIEQRLQKIREGKL